MNDFLFKVSSEGDNFNVMKREFHVKFYAKIQHIAK